MILFTDRKDLLTFLGAYWLRRDGAVRKCMSSGNISLHEDAQDVPYIIDGNTVHLKDKPVVKPGKSIVWTPQGVAVASSMLQGDFTLFVGTAKINYISGGKTSNGFVTVFSKTPFIMNNLEGKDLSLFKDSVLAIIPGDTAVFTMDGQGQAVQPTPAETASAPASAAPAPAQAQATSNTGQKK